MPGMPVQQRLGFRERRKMIGANQALRGDGTQIDDVKIAADFKRFRRGGIDSHAEAGRTAEQPEKNGFGRRPKCTRFGKRERGIERAAIFLEDDVLAADHVSQRALVRSRPCKPCFIVAPFGNALQRTLGVTEPRFWAEIGARGHEALR